MKTAPTLADAVIRESLRPHSDLPAQFGTKIASARRFVLDRDASRFMADLAHASFCREGDENNKRAIAAIEQTRQLARIPHALTWIEYDSRAFRERTLEAYQGVVNIVGLGERGIVEDQTPANLKEIPPTIGWLLQQDRETSFTLHSFLHAQSLNTALMPPFVLAWSTDDSVPPQTPFTGNSSQIATGISGYAVPQVAVARVPGFERIDQSGMAKMVVEFAGELRFAWALLVAINDVPIGLKHIIPSKGYVARGRYRKFLEHSVISILLPKGRNPKKVAQELVDISRRRAHQVRGHWRRDWRHEGNRVWVKEHERGDASLGFVTHDYEVKHELA